MKIEAKIIGDKKFMREVDKFVKDTDGDLQNLLARIAVRIHSTAIEAIQTGARSGVIYTRGTVKHQASAPGEYPKTDTGQLVNNITIKTDAQEYGKNKNPVRPEMVTTNSKTLTVGSRKGAPHGYYLEYKSPYKGGRPWLSRSFDEVENKFREYAKKSFKK